MTIISTLRPVNRRRIGKAVAGLLLGAGLLAAPAYPIAAGEPTAVQQMEWWQQQAATRAAAPAPAPAASGVPAAGGFGWG